MFSTAAIELAARADSRAKILKKILCTYQAKLLVRNDTGSHKRCHTLNRKQTDSI